MATDFKVVPGELVRPTSPGRRPVHPLVAQADVPHPKNGMLSAEVSSMDEKQRAELAAVHSAINRVKIQPPTNLPHDASIPAPTPKRRGVRFAPTADFLSPQAPPMRKPSPVRQATRVEESSDDIGIDDIDGDAEVEKAAARLASPRSRNDDAASDIELITAAAKMISPKTPRNRATSIPPSPRNPPLSPREFAVSPKGTAREKEKDDERPISPKASGKGTKRSASEAKITETNIDGKRVRLVNVEYRMCADGYYRRVEIDEEEDYTNPFDDAEEELTDEEIMLPMHANILMAFKNHPDLVKIGILNLEHYKKAKEGGPNRLERYMKYVNERVADKEKAVIISWVIELFYTGSCFVIEHLAETPMKDYYDKLKSKSMDYAMSIMRIPTVKRMGRKLIPTTSGSVDAAPSITGIIVVVSIQTIFGIVIALAAKWGMVAGKMTQAGAAVVNNGADNYVFKGKPVTDQFKTAFELIGKIINRKEYLNEGEVEAEEQVDVDMDEPE